MTARRLAAVAASLAIAASSGGAAYASNVSDVGTGGYATASTTHAQGSVTSLRKFTPGDEVRATSRSDTLEVSRDTYRDDSPNYADWGGLGTMSIGYEQSPAQKKSAQSLRAATDSANGLYSSSANKLTSADNHLRDDMKKDIDAANRLMGNQESAASDMDNAANKLNGDVSSVNDAIARAEYVPPTTTYRAASAGPNGTGGGGSAPASIPAPSGDATLGMQVLRYAMQFNGHPYVWAASGPDAFDCSGLVMYAYAHFGISLPHYSGLQAQAGREISPSDMKPGDILANDEHAALYYGTINGTPYVFNALNPQAGVTLTPLSWAFSGGYHIRRVY